MNPKKVAAPLAVFGIIVFVFVVLCIGPLFTIMAINQLAGEPAIPTSFGSWLAILWLTLLAGGVASRAGGSGKGI